MCLSVDERNGDRTLLWGETTRCRDSAKACMMRWTSVCHNGVPECWDAADQRKGGALSRHTEDRRRKTLTAICRYCSSALAFPGLVDMSRNVCLLFWSRPYVPAGGLVYAVSENTDMAKPQVTCINQQMTWPGGLRVNWCTVYSRPYTEHLWMGSLGLTFTAVTFPITGSVPGASGMFGTSFCLRLWRTRATMTTQAATASQTPAILETRAAG